MSYDQNEEFRRQQARQADEQRQRDAQRADEQRRQDALRAQQQRDNEARLAQAQREAERQRAQEYQNEQLRRQQEENINRQRQDNLRREENDRRSAQEEVSRHRQESDKRIREEYERKDAQDRQKNDYARQQQNLDQMRRAQQVPHQDWTRRESAQQYQTPSSTRTGTFLRISISDKTLSVLLKLLAFAAVVAVAIGSLLYWLGYLYSDSSGLALTGIPAIKTSKGLVYRKFDMNMEFRDGIIWARPEEVLPNSAIEAGPILNANLICPQSNFAVRGDLINSRITVPNGTLTIEGRVAGSFIAARRIVIHGDVEKTVESGTVFRNLGRFGSSNRLIKISAGAPIIGIDPRYPSRTAQKTP